MDEELSDGIPVPMESGRLHDEVAKPAEGASLRCPATAGGCIHNHASAAALFAQGRSNRGRFHRLGPSAGLPPLGTQP